MRAPGERIAIAIPDLRGGGAERVSLNLANAFAARGLAVDLVLMRAKGELMALLDPRVRVVDLEADRVRNVVLPLIRYLRASRPTSMLANMWPLTVLAILAKLVARAPTRIVPVEHVVLSRSEISWRPVHMALLKLFSRLLLPYADGIVCVSNGVADDLAILAGMPRGKIITIYNPIVAERDSVVTGTLSTHAKAWADATFRVLNVGTLKEQKDQRTLLRAFAILSNRIDAHLLVLGTGALHSELVALSSSLGIDHRVTFAGFAPEPASYYRHANLFVLSSAWEGFGNVIVEALEQGTPVVSTDCKSGPREILDDGKFGALVPVGDVDALARAMEVALSVTHDRDALKLRAQDFSVDKAADAYLELLQPNWREASLLAKQNG